MPAAIKSIKKRYCNCLLFFCQGSFLFNFLVYFNVSFMFLLYGIMKETCSVSGIPGDRWIRYEGYIRSGSGGERLYAFAGGGG